MPLPFEKVLKRPALRRVLIPFTLGLALIAMVAFFFMTG